MPSRNRETRPRYRVYLDACCLNRPFDDQSQARIRLESEAVLLVLARCATDQWVWIDSSVVHFEIDQSPDVARAARVRILTTAATAFVMVDPSVESRAEQVRAMGFHPMDALHIASAESGAADVLLSTDDRLVRRAARNAKRLQVAVRNPLRWISEEVM